MWRYFKLLGIFVKQSAMQTMAYRLNFWMVLVTNLAFFGVQFIFMKVIFLSTNSLAGWTKYDMFFYIGTFNIIDSLWALGPYFNIAGLPWIINSGGMDLYITKPVNSQFMVSLRKLELSSILSVFAGIIMVGYAMVMSGTLPSIGKVALYIFSIINALVIVYSVFFILSCLSFWVIKADFVDQIFGVLMYFALRPADIYKGVIRFIITFILPFGLAFTIAAKSGIKAITMNEYIVFLLITWGFFALSVLFWKYSLRRYSSASS